MAKYMMESTEMIRKKAMALLNGLTDDVIEGSGKMENSTGKVCTLHLITKRKKGNGRKENE